MSKQNRNISDLDNNFKIKVSAFMEDKEIKKLWVFITETFRTTERQQELYAQWRTTPWRVVTWLDWVKYKSIHQLWKAFDIWFNWKELYPKDFNIWRKVWNIAKKYWINWGYDLWWKDKPHFQDNPEIQAKHLLNNYKNMDLKKEFEENNFNALRLLISNMWKATDSVEFRKELENFWKYMDSIKK